MLCSKLHRQKGFKLIIFSYQIEAQLSHPDTPHPTQRQLRGVQGPQLMVWVIYLTRPWCSAGFRSVTG